MLLLSLALQATLILPGPSAHVEQSGRARGEMWFWVKDQPTFAVAVFWQWTKTGNGFTMVTCDPDSLVAPIHPKAMITILHPRDIDAWLRGTYDDVVALQRPYDPNAMTVRGPVFPTRNRGD